MAKTIKKIPWANIALVVGLGFAWSKLGLGTAVKDIVVPITQKPTCPAGQEAYILPGRTSYTCMTYEAYQAALRALRT